MLRSSRRGKKSKGWSMKCGRGWKVGCAIQGRLPVVVFKILPGIHCASRRLRCFLSFNCSLKERRQLNLMIAYYRTHPHLCYINPVLLRCFGVCQIPWYEPEQPFHLSIPRLAPDFWNRHCQLSSGANSQFDAYFIVRSKLKPTMFRVEHHVQDLL